jgi:hypothetical protein
LCQPSRCLAPSGFSGDRHNAYKYSWAHGTDFASARRIVTEGLIRPLTFDPHKEGEFPSFGFYALAALGGIDQAQIETLVRRLLRIGEGRQGVILLGEICSLTEHGILHIGSTVDEQHLVRRKGVVKGAERWCIHASYARLSHMAVSIPFHSILFYSTPFHSILFYSILFYAMLCYSILFYSILCYAMLCYSILF